MSSYTLVLENKISLKCLFENIKNSCLIGSKDVRI